MFTIENETLLITISEKGAELQNVFHKPTQTEWLWQDDSAYWGKRSPILFPFVGALKEGSFTFSGQTFAMSKHGFARDMVFQGAVITDYHVQFTLSSSDVTLTQYPFQFALTMDYVLVDHHLTATITVKNTDNIPMIFSVGAHPAFNCPMDEEAWQLVFDNVEHLESRCIDLTTGLIEPELTRDFGTMKTLPLTSDLFQQDALVFEKLNSKGATLEKVDGSRRLRFEWFGLPLFALWSPSAPFICLEPWLGMADLTNSTGNLDEKNGTQSLEPGCHYVCSYKLEL